MGDETGVQDGVDHLAVVAPALGQAAYPDPRRGGRCVRRGMRQAYGNGGSGSPSPGVDTQA